MIGVWLYRAFVAAMLALLAAWLFVAPSLVRSAPAPSFRAPRARAPQVPQVTAGRWTLHFAGTDYGWTLGPGGTHQTTGGVWFGSWAWCPATRHLTVHESCGGAAWNCWTVRLDADMRGTCEAGSAYGPARVRLEPKGGGP
jgi:hypothetical protein